MMRFCALCIQWDLVCDKNVLPEASQMVFNFGVMFGAILFGFLSDKFGRKKSFVFALVAQAIVGCVTAASPNFYVFTILRFIIGALEQVLDTIFTFINFIYQNPRVQTARTRAAPEGLPPRVQTPGVCTRGCKQLHVGEELS